MGQGDSGRGNIGAASRKAAKNKREAEALRTADEFGFTKAHEGKYIKPSMVPDKYGENRRAEREKALNARAAKLGEYYLDEEAAKLRNESRASSRGFRTGANHGEVIEEAPFTEQELAQARQRAQARAKAELMPGFEKAEEERAKLQPKLAERSPEQVRELRNNGYDRRIVSKARQQDSKVGQTNQSMIEAHNRSVDLAEEVNRRIGVPEAGAYKGFTNGSVNQAYAYAHSKAADGAKSAGRHAENANAAARGLQDYATQQQEQIKKDTGLEKNAQQAQRMASIVQHLVKRQQNNAPAAPPIPVGNGAPMQQGGLINSVKPIGGTEGVFAQASDSAKVFK